MTTFINCAEDEVSSGIVAEMEDCAEGSVKLVGRYQHPAHFDSRDWDVRLYNINCDGFETCAFSTNGDPVWQENDQQAFEDMLEEYEIA